VLRYVMPDALQDARSLQQRLRMFFLGWRKRCGGIGRGIVNGAKLEVCMRCSGGRRFVSSRRGRGGGSRVYCRRNSRALLSAESWTVGKR